MITPRFSCSQTDTSVLVSIYCPSIRASEVEINVDETLLTVHINPYFLRLNFPHSVLEDDDSSARYDPSSGCLTVTLTKEKRGLNFEDLDLLAKLLAPRSSADSQVGPSIEVLDSQDTPEVEEKELAQKAQNLSLDEERREILEAAANDWRLPQTVPDNELQTSVQKHYGFLDLYSGYFRNASNSPNEVNELGIDAETCAAHERRTQRLQHENEKWDEEHYMADYADDEYIQELLHWKNPQAIIGSSDFAYTEAENATMLRLPRKEYIFTSHQADSLYHTLISILFAYAYDTRVTQHDPTPESAWTIASLTPAFSALDPAPYPAPTQDALANTVVASYRRALAFPLYRSWELNERCRMDVVALLRAGIRTIVRCLLEVKDILDHHEAYYVYSKIWVDDLLTWTMSHTTESILFNFGERLFSLKMNKAWMEWDLEELEASVRETLDGSRGVDSDDETDEE